MKIVNIQIFPGKYEECNDEYYINSNGKYEKM